MIRRFLIACAVLVAACAGEVAGPRVGARYCVDDARTMYVYVVPAQNARIEYVPGTAGSRYPVALELDTGGAFRTFGTYEGTFRITQNGQTVEGRTTFNFPGSGRWQQVGDTVVFSDTRMPWFENAIHTVVGEELHTEHRYETADVLEEARFYWVGCQ